ncbi:hypothetical protein NKJ72_17015 [Mesorhizobium sp. M0045]|uniref:hypothetical protein n=1 Tax=unclassified Mesorhizobium TaxID=325217 RepID=UPI00333CCB59
MKDLTAAPELIGRPEVNGVSVAAGEINPGHCLHVRPRSGSAAFLKKCLEWHRQKLLQFRFREQVLHGIELADADPLAFAQRPSWLNAAKR